jgi:hypothetical protein
VFSDNESREQATTKGNRKVFFSILGPVQTVQFGRTDILELIHAGRHFFLRGIFISANGSEKYSKV